MALFSVILPVGVGVLTILTRVASMVGNTGCRSGPLKPCCWVFDLHALVYELGSWSQEKQSERIVPIRIITLSGFQGGK